MQSQVINCINVKFPCTDRILHWNIKGISLIIFCNIPFILCSLEIQHLQIENAGDDKLGFMEK